MILIKIFALGFLAIASCICYEIWQILHNDIERDWLLKASKIGIVLAWLGVVCLVIGVILI